MWIFENPQVTTLIQCKHTYDSLKVVKEKALDDGTIHCCSSVFMRLYLLTRKKI